MENNEVLAPESAKANTPAISTSEDVSFMNMIAKFATDPNVDMARIDKLIELRDNENAKKAKALFDQDFVRMKPHLPKVAKSAKNNQTKSTYAKLDDINQEIDPILSEYGFGTASKVIGQTDNTVTMRLELKHRGGHSETMELTMPIDDKGAQGTVNKTKIHAIASTITYIKRVGFCALLNISTGDDKDGNVEREIETITVEQAAAIDTRARALGDDYHKRFISWLKDVHQVDGVTEIPETLNATVLGALKKAEAEAAKVKK